MNSSTNNTPLRSVELFAGAGGLALGIAKAGFHHEIVAEWEKNACETIRTNQKRKHPLIQGCEIFQGDVRNLSYAGISNKIDLVSGGPPCQPFSLGGKHRGHQDSRDMFPEAVRAVRELMPRAFIFENVKGLLRESFSTYFSYIQLQLTHPEIIRHSEETWQNHLARLENHHTGNSKTGLCYRVIHQCLNSANYGIPQKRERVIFVGIRSDLDLPWSFPDPTHSQDSLIQDQWITGDYWEHHRIAKKNQPEMPPKLKNRVEKIRGSLFKPEEKPWMTVRDALADLPDPRENHDTLENHEFRDGARSYPGHTGSPLDEPSKALKAGVHGVPGGENMISFKDGQVRYLTVRESARLQTFPDDYVFQGSWTESMRQLGNAVPMNLGYAVAKSVRERLSVQTKH